jgi:hypothetical protein
VTATSPAGHPTSCGGPQAHWTDAVPDPRHFRDAASAPAAARELYALAEGELGAETGQRADAIAHELSAALAARLDGEGPALAAAIEGAPSVSVARHLWRALDSAWRDRGSECGVALAAFAIPLVIVAGAEGGGDIVLPGVLADTERLAAILVDAGALGGNRNFALADVAVGPEAIDIARLPEIASWLGLRDVGGGTPSAARKLEPSPIHVRATSESVHLRFLFGTAIANANADLFADGDVGKWGVALSRELARQLRATGASLLVLPRAPQRMLPALYQGRAAQREVSAQIFASNAIRALRASVGEPTAVISAHRAPDACGGGELRLSLSSPFDPRRAEGFRCPLYPQDRVADVVSMLVDLLRDCRVAMIHAVSGIHSDRIDGAGGLLLFKPDTMPAHVTLVPR